MLVHIFSPANPIKLSSLFFFPCMFMCYNECWNLYYTWRGGRRDLNDPVNRLNIPVQLNLSRLYFIRHISNLPNQRSKRKFKDWIWERNFSLNKWLKNSEYLQLCDCEFSIYYYHILLPYNMMKEFKTKFIIHFLLISFNKK